MRATFKTVFYVNASKEKNGIVPIMGRVTINGTIAPADLGFEDVVKLVLYPVRLFQPLTLDVILAVCNM